MEKLGGQIEQMAGKIGENSPDQERDRKIFSRGQEEARTLRQWAAEHPRPSPFDLEKVTDWERQYNELDKKLRGDHAMSYSCQVCHDTGWNISSNGVHLPCSSCSTYNPEENLKKYSGVPERRWRDTFETFNLKKAPAMAEALKAAKEFASRVSVPWLVLGGPIGCGKTHLCYAVANSFAQDRVTCRFWNVAGLLGAIRSTYDQKQAGDNSSERVEDMVNTPTVLILDDLGAEKESDWVAEKLFDIIDRRYSTGKGLMVTTNVSRKDLSPRLQSRFSDKEICRVVMCNSPDFRIRLAPRKIGIGTN